MYGVDFCAAATAAAAIRIFLVSYLYSGMATWVLSGGENRVGMHLCMGNRCSCIRRNLQLLFSLSRKLGVCGGGFGVYGKVDFFLYSSILSFHRFSNALCGVCSFSSSSLLSFNTLGDAYVPSSKS